MVTLSDGRKAIKQKNYTHAIQILTPLAEAGNSDALLELGFLYCNGLGVTKDLSKALEFYIKSADLGNAEAEYAIGVGCEYKTFRNVGTAEQWCARAAKRGHALAQYWMGKIELNRHNTCDAMNWLKLSASQKQADACWELYLIYQNNEDENSKEEAAKWLKEAADRKHYLGQNKYGEYLRAKGDLAKAFEYFQKSAKRGWSNALTNLGLAYLNGEGTEQNKKLAFEQFSMADRKGNVSATYNKDPLLAAINSWNLYLLYRDGIAGEKMDEYSAYNCCYAARHMAEANFELGRFNEHGIGVAQSLPDALNWYQRAADAGYSEANLKVEDIKKQLSDAEIKKALWWK